MEWWQAIVLGVVEGITEFLPVSSTGHLIIAGAMLGMDDPETKDAVDGFMIIVQGAAILAIVGLYWPRMVQMLRGLMGRDPAGLRLFWHISLAFLPFLLLAPVLYPFVRRALFTPGPVLLALFLGGLWMIWLGRRDRKRRSGGAGIEIEEMTWKHALGVGLFQCVSMWPGTSRAMMTIAGGTVIGLKPARAAEFSFLLGLPTIAGATVYELGGDLYKSHRDGTPNMFEQLGLGPVMLGMVVTVIVAAATMRWLVGFLGRHSLAAFGWYRVVLATALAVLLVAGVNLVTGDEPAPPGTPPAEVSPLEEASVDAPEPGVLEDEGLLPD